MDKTVFVFPGQASQSIGMAKDFYNAYPLAKQTFEAADDLLGFRLSALCFEGPEAILNETINTQPAIYVTSIAILRVLKSQFPEVHPIFLAGHSLGEFSAITAADALSFEHGVMLVRERGRLMKEAGEKHPGAMAALLGVDADKAREICDSATRQSGKPVVLANDNCPGQIVISGDIAAIDAAIELAQAAGVKRAVKLAVSIAAHSPLMHPAAADFRKLLDEATFTTPQTPIYGNVDATPITTVEALRHELELQLTQSVRWAESIQAMISAGVETFIEIGPGDVLAGLIRRIDRGMKPITLNTIEALKKLKEAQ